ncbi:MAG: recombination mediator RecR [Candidatus Omnitrophica bacterium]|nr:recombination mediator RecR [Candidatus Omnitrophota bacterium]
MAKTTGLPESLLNLIEYFKKFPGIGQKTAQRLAFFVLKSPAAYVKDLSEALTRVKQVVRFCKLCNNLSDEELCAICKDSGRDRGIICVVEEPTDVIAVEKTGKFPGVYHVLLGALSPLDGIGPDELKIKELLARVKEKKPKEVIIATNPDTEGETTALYLAKVLKPFNIRTTRIGFGMPIGAELEYVDQATLLKAMDSRRELA